ncbi:MAG: hypothetical protein O4804_10410 [Trichodesmium sp. St11_bin5]|nr:hypothetical protein [Trichodesmium sp. St11_bin5]
MIFYSIQIDGYQKLSSFIQLEVEIIKNTQTKNYKKREKASLKRVKRLITKKVKKVIAIAVVEVLESLAITFFMTKSSFATGKIYLQYGDLIFHRS